MEDDFFSGVRVFAGMRQNTDCHGNVGFNDEGIIVRIIYDRLMAFPPFRMGIGESMPGKQKGRRLPAFCLMLLANVRTAIAM